MCLVPEGQGHHCYPRQSQLQSSGWYLRAGSQQSKPCLSPPIHYLECLASLSGPPRASVSQYGIFVSTGLW